MMLSRTLAIKHNTLMGLQLATSRPLPFLSTGVTTHAFSCEGKIPDRNEALKSSQRSITRSAPISVFHCSTRRYHIMESHRADEKSCQADPNVGSCIRVDGTLLTGRSAGETPEMCGENLSD
ncbi:Hypothetical protein NTJ_02602 [Nesidiocoris tenuis]|uniref:Uncharacterized protein n=1 Tax=Nesidiocoris tenuis TaxID=355587 RepID=A0ABN7AC07_9HEMI|nr:Hypothetical protein NTJ_02602 [Nesidiocoris tenuis]